MAKIAADHVVEDHPSTAAVFVVGTHSLTNAVERVSTRVSKSGTGPAEIVVVCAPKVITSTLVTHSRQTSAEFVDCSHTLLHHLKTVRANASQPE
jgi:hypothetical protein